MPMIHIEMLEGRSVDEKRELVSSVTRAVVASLNGIAAEGVKIHLVEISPQNTARGGVLRADRESSN